MIHNCEKFPNVFNLENVFQQNNLVMEDEISYTQRKSTISKELKRLLDLLFSKLIILLHIPSLPGVILLEQQKADPCNS